MQVGIRPNESFLRLDSVFPLYVKCIWLNC